MESPATPDSSRGQPNGNSPPVPERRPSLTGSGSRPGSKSKERPAAGKPADREQHRGHQRARSGYVGDVNVHVAAYEGDMEKLQKYVQLGGDLEKKDSYQATPLLLASEKGHEECVRFLLDSGASITARDEHQYTALHLAAYYGRVNVVPVLLERGADLQAVDDRGRTPKRLASRKEISKLLAVKEREAKMGMDIHTAVERNDIDMLKQYIKSKGNLDMKGRNDMTPLHIACFNGYSEIVKLLLDAGADPMVVDEDQDTPLHYACSSGATDIITMLLTKGADPTALDGMGRTPGDRNSRQSIQKLLEEESYRSIPKNIAAVRRLARDLQARVDSNESLFVQKAIAIKGLRLALEEKDGEIRMLKKKVMQQDSDLRALKSKMAVAEEMMKQIASASSSSRGKEALADILTEVAKKNMRGGECHVS